MQPFNEMESQPLSDTDTCQRPVDYAEEIESTTAQQNTGAIVPSKVIQVFERADSPDQKHEDDVPELQYTISQDEDADCPTLVINDRQLNDVGDEAIEILQESNVPPTTFVRAGTLCRIINDERKGPVIQTVTTNILSAMLAKACDTVHVTEKGLKNVFPPKGITTYILTEGMRSFPIIEGIVKSPTIRPDGTVSQVPGYDSVTGLFYHKEEDSKTIEVPENPTREQVQTALALIEELLHDFPFDCQASRANMIAMLLSPIMQPAIDDIMPLFLLDAPTAGSGKTLLARVIWRINSETVPEFTDTPTQETEWSKQITASLSEGSPLVILDNLSDILKSKHLTMLLTAGVWKNRPFGKNTEMKSLPNRTTWLATGNNIQIGGDMPRRCVWIRIDPEMAKPHERDGFLHPNLEEWVKDNRERLLVALLTLCRFWYADGCPTYPTPTFGSFEKWCSIVGSIMAHAGVSGFLENRDGLWEQSDSESGEWETFLAAWQRIYGAVPITAKELLEDITHGNDISNAIPESVSEAISGNGDKCSKIGFLFKARLEKRYGARNLRLEKMPRNSKGQPWTVLSD